MCEKGKKISFCLSPPCRFTFSTSLFLTSATKYAYLLVFITIANCFVVTTEACYLRNCPVGKWEGKRSGFLAESNARTPKKICPACGPNNSHGRCMGPHICCIPGLGCTVGPDLPFTKDCSVETNDPVPCMPEGISCGEQSEGGICGLEGVCCTDEKCQISTECSTLNPLVSRIMKALRNR